MMARRFRQIFPELLHRPANTFTATFQAFERYGVMRILAEPTVTPDNPNFAWARRPIVFGGGQRNSMR
jgi:hypothetical protein